jgi:hypothetical protein
MGCKMRLSRIVMVVAILILIGLAGCSKQLNSCGDNCMTKDYACTYNKETNKYVCPDDVKSATAECKKKC